VCVCVCVCSIIGMNSVVYTDSTIGTDSGLYRQYSKHELRVCIASNIGMKSAV
jgi:hypothetical protein